MFSLLLAITVYFHNNFVLQITAVILGLLLDAYIIKLFRRSIIRSFDNRKILQAHIESLNQEIQTYTEELSYKTRMETLGNMLENIAHLWRQPLCAISVASSGLKLKHEIGLLDSSELGSTIDVMNEHIQNLSASLDEFRFLYKKEPVLEIFSIRQCFRKVRELLEYDIFVHEVCVKYKVESFSVLGYENIYAQVLIQLLHSLMNTFTSNNKARLICIKIYAIKNVLHIELKNNQYIEPSRLPQIESRLYTQLQLIRRLVQDQIKGKLSQEYMSAPITTENYHGLKFTLMVTK